MIRIKRVYEPAEESDGIRFFVERLWPRGIKKENLVMQAWLKEVAPSAGLRKWYQHELAKWEEFQNRYQAELDASPSSWEPLIDAARAGDLTLLYASRDTEHNSALVLKNYLTDFMKRS